MEHWHYYVPWRDVVLVITVLLGAYTAYCWWQEGPIWKGRYD